MKTESIEKELDLCHYLVCRINKLIPMCNAVESITKTDNKMMATITFMNGKSVYITQYHYNKKPSYNTNKCIIGFTYYNDYNKSSVHDLHWEIFCMKNGSSCDFYQDINYKDVSFSKFMKHVNDLVMSDLNKMLDETDF